MDKTVYSMDIAGRQKNVIKYADRSFPQGGSFLYGVHSCLIR